MSVGTTATPPESSAAAAASSPATSDFTAFTGNLRRRGAYESLWTGSAPVLRR